jgi:hypothetical protein
MTSTRSAVLWVLLLTGLPSLALAQCTTRSDASALKKTVKLAAKCNLRRLQRGPTVTCKTSPPPACAGTLATDAIALAWGANNPAAAAIDRRLLHDQYNCQKAISKGVVDFVTKKLGYLIDGLSAAEAETKARRSIDKLPDKCAVTVAQDVSLVIVPDVGPQLDAAVPLAAGGARAGVEAARRARDPARDVGRSRRAARGADAAEHRLHPE